MAKPRSGLVLTSLVYTFLLQLTQNTQHSLDGSLQWIVNMAGVKANELSMIRLA